MRSVPRVTHAANDELPAGEEPRANWGFPSISTHGAFDVDHAERLIGKRSTRSASVLTPS